MGSEVVLSPGGMFDEACMHTVPHIHQGGTLYNGLLKMSNMEILGL